MIACFCVFVWFFVPTLRVDSDGFVISSLESIGADMNKSVHGNIREYVCCGFSMVEKKKQASGFTGCCALRHVAGVARDRRLMVIIAYLGY